MRSRVGSRTWSPEGVSILRGLWAVEQGAVMRWLFLRCPGCGSYLVSMAIGSLPGEYGVQTAFIPCWPGCRFLGRCRQLR